MRYRVLFAHIAGRWTIAPVPHQFLKILDTSPARHSVRQRTYHRQQGVRQQKALAATRAPGAGHKKKQPRDICISGGWNPPNDKGGGETVDGEEEPELLPIAFAWSVR
jgi:hypothetical protein